jgi:hypothetical protein
MRMQAVVRASPLGGDESCGAARRISCEQPSSLIFAFSSLRHFVTSFSGRA